MRACDMIVNLYAKNRWNRTESTGIRVVFPSDKHWVLDFVSQEFPDEKGWLLEVEKAILKDTCVIMVEGDTICGFACFDATARGYFGPLGVKYSERGKGFGKLLLRECMERMKIMGYGYAVIGWVSEAMRSFYQDAVGAMEIPCSEPDATLYKRKINIAVSYPKEPLSDSLE